MPFGSMSGAKETRFAQRSPTALVSQLIDDADLAPDQIQAIRREVDSKLDG